MWFAGLFVIVTQFALMGLILAVIVFALYQWFKHEGPDPIS